MSVAGTRLGQVSHPDLAAEQAYLDEAYDCLDRMREALIRAAEAGATEVAAEAIESWANERLRTFADAERGLCFGRIDSEEASDAIYVGRRWVHDDDRGALIVNWQAPAARPFYTATPAEPHGVTLRRRFRTRGRTLTGISDEALDGSLAAAAAAVDDFLLEELERTRDARMRDIVATIQADQYNLIAREPEPPLVVQGGPGTGRPLWACTAPRSCSTPTAPSCAVSSSSGRTRPSWSTSRMSCPRSARRVSTSVRSPSSSAASPSLEPTRSMSSGFDGRSDP